VTGDGWQAELWRRLSISSSGSHWIHLQQQLRHTLSSDDAIDKLPERISIFALSTLSPGYLETVRCISEQIDVHLFLLNPCAAHWTEIVDEKKKAKCEEDADGSELYLEVGHPLLASLGRQGRDFVASLYGYDPTIIDLFETAKKQNLLGQLQQDIQHLHDRSADQKLPLPLKDQSLQFHSCHSVMREVEVLKDQLLDIFQKNKNIAPSDVLVMSPDMESYATYIEALFSASDAAVIPYNITNSGAALDSPLIDGFFKLLQISKSRLDSNSIIDLLEIKAIQKRFEIAKSDLDLIIHWIRECGIRWGRDATERERLGLPNTNQNSWHAGLDRMLLGYALPGNETQLFQGILPYDDIEGVGAAVLGSLNAFMAALFDLQIKLQSEYSIDRWCQLLCDVLESFFAPAEQEENQVQLLRNGVEALSNQSHCADFKGKVSAELIHKHLKTQLASEQGGHRALNHGVTFSALTSMRSLPYKVICLIGMNDGAFPKQRPKLGFDLTARQFRFGDRNHRADDRYLFLEALMSVRHTLYISFIGQHIRDNSQLPPSGLVDELLDYLDRCYHTDEKDGIREHCVTHHPLQAYSQRYFRLDSRLTSYSKEMFQAHQANTDVIMPGSPFFSYPLSEPDQEWRKVELMQLIKFYSNPARYLIQHRLGIYYEKEEELLDTTEPFTLEYFNKCELNQYLVEKCLTGESNGNLHLQARASGELPHGCFGDQIFAKQMGHSKKFIDRLKPYLDLSSEMSVEVDVRQNDMQLYGRLNKINRDGQFYFSVHSIWNNQLLELWIRHLVLNVMRSSGVQLTSRWLDDKKLHCFMPVETPEKYLAELLDLYWHGLQYPLHFFPKSSFEYMTHRAKDKSVEECISKAKQKWCGDYNNNNECDNAYYNLAFSTDDPLDDSFKELSEIIFKPLLEHLQST
ncbi:exodeoxyribonuclease V subunit gamma, partial [Pseudomonadota bacterium]